MRNQIIYYWKVSLCRGQVAVPFQVMLGRWLKDRAEGFTYILTHRWHNRLQSGFDVLLNVKQLNKKLEIACQFLSPTENRFRCYCVENHLKVSFQSMKLIVGWENHDWVLCLGWCAFIFEKHFLPFSQFIHVASLVCILIVVFLEQEYSNRHKYVEGWETGREAQGPGRSGVSTGRGEANYCQHSDTASTLGGSLMVYHLSPVLSQKLQPREHPLDGKG